MIRQSAVVLVLSTVVLAAVVSGVVVVDGQRQNTSCTCTTVQEGDQTNATNVAVVVNGSYSSISTNQRTDQSDGRTRVRVVAKFDGESVTVSGETAENGTLVFNVTHNGTLVNESVVLRSSENRTLVVRVNPEGVVRVTRNDAVCDVDVAATGVNLEIAGIDIGGKEDDTGDSFGCTTTNSSCACSASSTELSPPVRRLPASAENGVGVFRVVVRSSDLEGLAAPSSAIDCAGVDSEVTADCRSEAG